MKKGTHVQLVSAVALICALAAPVGAENETRRQIGSMSIDHALGFNGSGINIGDLYSPAAPMAHTSVPFTRRAADAPGANDPGDTLHALETAGIMVSNHPTFTGMAPGAALFTDHTGNNGIPAGTVGTAGENNVLDGINCMTLGGANCFAPGNNGPGVKAINGSFRIGTAHLERGIDWFISQPQANGGDFLYFKSSGNSGAMPVSNPGNMFNGMTVGAATNEDYQVNTTTSQGPVNRRWNVLANYSTWGSTATVSKPEIVAPGGRIDTDDPIGGNNSMEQGFTMATGTNNVITLPANGFQANNTGAGNRTRISL